MCDRMFDLMIERGIKNHFIEKAIGGYRGKLSELKKGKTSLTDDEIATIATILGTSSAYLKYETDIKEVAAQPDGLSEQDRSILELLRSLPQEDQARAVAYLQALVDKQ